MISLSGLTTKIPEGILQNTVSEADNADSHPPLDAFTVTTPPV